MANFLYYEDTIFDNVTGVEKNKLLELKTKLSDIIDDIKTQPEGSITVKKSGHIFTTGFSGIILKKISDRLNS